MRKSKEAIKTIYIVILNFNGWKDTIECLNSILNIEYYNTRLIIIDNDPTDDSVQQIGNWMKEEDTDFDIPDINESEIITKTTKRITFIKSSENGGYSYGNNIGIKYALKDGADYVLILNNDTIVDPGFLQPLVDMCEDDKSIGLATGKIFFFDSLDVIWFNGGKFN